MKLPHLLCVCMLIVLWFWFIALNINRNCIYLLFSVRFLPMQSRFESCECRLTGILFQKPLLGRGEQAICSCKWTETCLLLFLLHLRGTSAIRSNWYLFGGRGGGGALPTKTYIYLTFAALGCPSLKAVSGTVVMYSVEASPSTQGTKLIAELTASKNGTTLKCGYWFFRSMT